MHQVAHISSVRPAAEIIPENYFAPLELVAHFGRDAPLEVDLGCGDGSFLAAMALNNPSRNFLGIERLLGRVRSASRKITPRGIVNARVLRMEISYAVRHLLPPGSVAVFHLMFPDPWPKRRHHRRRIVTEDFFGSIHRALAQDGLLRITTDQIDYFQEIVRKAAGFPQFIPGGDREELYPRSTFERNFAEEGLELHRLVLRKVSDVT
ncbi:MAG TPA: tRNA (guanosine(46)-N7)-methyltransferase TrmB [Chthoniobacterales bacterium]